MRADFGDRATSWFAGYVCGLAVAAAIALCHGCAGNITLPKAGLTALPVAVVAWPSPVKANCELSSLPPLPDIALWTKPEDEPAPSRYYVTARQLADLLSWLKDVTRVVGMQEHCLRLLTEPP